MKTEMKINMSYGTFKQWKDIYSRDSITTELWNMIGENKDLIEQIEYKNRNINNQDNEIYYLREKLKKLRKKLK